MRIYIAGPWADRDHVRNIAKQFVAAGFEITHPWWDIEDTDGTYLQDNVNVAFYEGHAMGDYHGVVNAGAVVVVNSQKSEGKAVEQGIAIAHFKPIVVIGKPSHIFHYLPNVTIVPDTETAMRVLAE